VNEFVTEEPLPSGLFAIDPEVEAGRQLFLGGLRASRNARVVAEARLALEQAARGHANLLPFILDAVNADVTLGEICDSLREVFGSHQPSVVF